ncbi:1-epi-valienol-1,7-bisphosphate-1-adenylyltransferase [Actinoplanes sp. SE50]|uniref:sugar phosphate nucleotidyltransferase n=1 Tax=unclassified Actinoplanes TaxID=2626549 RepID=UPI00006CA2D3|nr:MULTISPECIES: sugar phosphate nucleotidyltransferase [unclassified Actinoplanes]AEV84565.1 1-epi-valienol-1,7-bisphosphate-1-adenylyltransferase [Actinoplanes sp. SE50/110]ATO82957.1 1-epi-valienol-1,7-bisphosphate-1-adenylyltransferase [Actinoplanes sp. SE50]CAJ81025.1 putative 1-epi-valienol-1,7-bisphosphate-1-adenylyltransferase AcbR [Actinoplanes sp. SE50/110]SLM00365.1 1-epi-valienol-1,7-bisphosphate-1-adenylyltransferase [Actinoplanes sp. SE50/110]
MSTGVRAVLLAGGEGRRMGALGAGRLKPLVPFGGAARLIDFSLANARDSGLDQVLLLSQYQERQLMDDLRRTWWQPGFRVHFGPYDRAYTDGIPVEYEPPTGPPERGTADALIRKAPYLFGPDVTEVLVQHADHVYRFDYRPMIAEHRASGAALTVSYQRIDRRYVHLFGMVEFDDRNRLVSFVEKPAEPTSDLVFAAFCVFDAAVLHRYLELLDGTDWQHDISRDVIPAMLAAGEHIRGCPVPGYWADIGTVERYHEAHLSLVGTPPSLAVDAMPWTVAPRTARALVTSADGVRHSVVPADLVNHGTVERSVLFPAARIGPGATVRDSVLLPGAVVPAGAEIDGAVVLEDGTVQQVTTGARR